ncbi:adenylyltransferase and sulfurtransferase MOCS3 [Biomphalaria pfeifferi]|uniref:Adenylyltransferase and sulfurtransferase MOCS3 homolog n=1 Tax=Biomphalaria pfeifferi TaxID=112525 RepID=A0AAD8B961_BIOPF|nr:adenylyltransferase and sulfurtransferase MOCS3 [Biomphalaria pfeifferi]
MNEEQLRNELQNKEKEIQRLKKLLGEDEHFKLLTVPEKDLEKQKEKSETLSKEDISRYSRQLILDDFGVKGQIAVKNTNVLIVGAGGLGCPAAIYLAAAGIGRLGVIDYDEVELSNLHRQILHTVDRVGLSKSLSVVQSCCRLNPSTEYVPYHLQLDSSNALRIIESYDIILDATDNVATRYLLNDACVLAGKPLVSGSALRFEGQLTVYHHDGGPCYRCLYPQPPPSEAVTNCSEGGVLGVVPGIIGSLQALEAIKIATGIGTSFSQKLLLFDALDGTFRTVKLRPRCKSCLVCGENPTISQLIDYEQFCGAKATDKDHKLHLLERSQRISAKEYSEMVNSKKPHVLVDVRPAIELDICQLPHPVINIPFTSLSRNITEVKDQLLLKLKELSSDDFHDYTVPVVCVCRRGNDSQLAVQQLMKVLADDKVKVIDIKGGLHSWSKHIDSHFPIY